MAFLFIIRPCVAALCCIGLYVSFYMVRKYQSAQRGELTETSVVTSTNARLARVPNAYIGLIYYAALLVVTPLLSSAHPLVLGIALFASAMAALASVYLAYSLLFITRMPCVYCWVGHVINWCLLGALLVLVNTPSP